MKQAINKVVSSINAFFSEKPAGNSTKVISEPGFIPTVFNKTFFHNISYSEFNNKIAFVDGGSSPVIKTACFGVFFIRLYCSIWQSGKKTGFLKSEFFCIVSLKKSNSMKFCIELVPAEESGNTPTDVFVDSFDFFDKVLCQNTEQDKVSYVAGCARRCGELFLAKTAVQKLSPNDMVVLDGTLNAASSDEENKLSSLFEEAEAKGIAVGALSKTTHMVTDAGESAVSAIQKMSDSGKWYYDSVARSKNNIGIFLAKLHERSKHVFRFDLYKPDSTNVAGIFSGLALNSRDPVFPGYPYGMIDADRCARVSNSEKEFLRTIFSSKIDLQKYDSELNAHEILDKIQY